MTTSTSDMTLNKALVQLHSVLPRRYHASWDLQPWMNRDHAFNVHLVQDHADRGCSALNETIEWNEFSESDASPSESAEN